MLTLMQDPEAYAGDRAALQSIVNNLMSLLQMKNQRIYLHSHQVANYAASIAVMMRQFAEAFVPIFAGM